jgi:CBS domain-containing membrane protein
MHGYLQHSQLEPYVKLSQIKRDHYYSNGQYGKHWSVRQIIDESAEENLDEDRVVYKVLAGAGRRNTVTCTRVEFADWAVYEVFRNENSWQKIA